MDEHNNESGLFSVEKLFMVAGRQKPSQEYIPTFVPRFDKAMDGGFRGGELIVMSGETGQGKTMFALNLSKNISDAGVPVLWYTYEMQEYYLRQKMEQMGITEDNPIYAPVNLSESSLKFITDEAQNAYDTYACKVVFIDHLHYLIPLESEGKNMSLMVGGLVRGLKTFAKKTGLIIVLIAHTKKIYQDEELSLSSVRDSSLICQEADYVFLVQREKIQRVRISDPRAMEADGSPWGEEWTNKTKVSLAKNRRTGGLMFQRFEYKNGLLIPLDYEYQDTSQVYETGADEAQSVQGTCLP